MSLKQIGKPQYALNWVQVDTLAREVRNRASEANVLYNGNGEKPTLDQIREAREYTKKALEILGYEYPEPRPSFLRRIVDGARRLYQDRTVDEVTFEQGKAIAEIQYLSLAVVDYKTRSQQAIYQRSQDLRDITNMEFERMLGM